MSDLSIPMRSRFALGAAMLVAAAAFLATSSGPVGAGGLQEFTLTPASAEVGDTVSAANNANSVCRSGIHGNGEGSGLILVDADDNEVFSAAGTLDGDENWTIDIDTTGLEAGTYTVKAWCEYPQGRSNYQSETLTLTAAAEPTTTTTEVETTTSTTEAPTTTAAPAVEEPNAAPAGPVDATPSYTG